MRDFLFLLKVRIKTEHTVLIFFYSIKSNLSFSDFYVFFFIFFCLSEKYELACSYILCYNQDLNLVNQDLTASAVIGVMSSDNPGVADGEGSFNLELEVMLSLFYLFYA